MRGDFKYSIGDIINTHNRNIIIIDREQRSNNVNRSKSQTATKSVKKWYKYCCLNCNNEDWIEESKLSSKKNPSGCNVCCSGAKKVLRGFNDISTTAPWMVKYIIDKEYVYTHTKYCKEKTLIQCPYCKNIQMKSPMQIASHHSIACICNDNQSYPNKFMFELLSQLNIDFNPEMKFEWSGYKRYDYYFVYNEEAFIMEMHGSQHYKGKETFRTTLEENIKNDYTKQTLAIENGINHYYQIDCSISDCDYIKNSIISSRLLSDVGINEFDIDWGKCDEFATSNFYYQVAKYHDDNPLLTEKQIAKHFKVYDDVIKRAVKQGMKFGWCKYDFTQDRPIYCKTNDNYYHKSNDVFNHLFLDKNICTLKNLRVGISKNHKYRGYEFEYITFEKFNEEKRKSPEKCHGDFFNIKENVA